MMWFGVITLFPEMFTALNAGITGRALNEKLVQIDYWNPRDFTQSKHRNVDDRPYGGGPGMVMMAEPLQLAIQQAKQRATEQTKVVYLSPQGKLFDQAAAKDILSQQQVILLAGRYEGIDERLITLEIDEEWSIGNYVLSGGELAAMVVIDAVTRLIPGALGHKDSAAQDSLSAELLKYPQYTRPEVFQGLSVPEILLSGNHSAIERWRLKQSLGQTWLKRPELLANRQLSKLEQDLLMEFVEEQKL